MKDSINYLIAKFKVVPSSKAQILWATNWYP